MVKKIYGLPHCPACIQVKNEYPEAEYIILDSKNEEHNAILKKAIEMGQTKAPIVLGENDEIFIYWK
jgi:glutaredoxin